jgi:hypothetical protein
MPPPEPSPPAAAPRGDRLEAIAMLVAARRETTEIARVLGVPLSFIYACKESPAFAARVAELRGAENAVRQRLDDDALVNVDFIRSVRNGEHAGEDPKAIATRMDAAKALLERQVRKDVVEQQAPAIHIHIDASRHATMERVMAEDAGPVIDIEAVSAIPGLDDIDSR